MAYSYEYVTLNWHTKMAFSKLREVIHAKDGLKLRTAGVVHTYHVMLFT